MIRAVIKSEIPTPIIDGLELINKNAGNTSLIFALSETKVRVITRDAIKADWSYFVLHKYYGLTLEYNITPYIVTPVKYRTADLFALPLLVYDMERLYPLDPVNKKRAQVVVNTFNKIEQEFRLCNKILEKLQEGRGNEEEDNYCTQILQELGYFTSNYTSQQYTVDLAVRNFMQTVEGRLIPLDIVASIDCIKCMKYKPICS